MLKIVDQAQRLGHDPIGEVRLEDPALDDLLELVSILPPPRQIGLRDDVEHEVHRLEPERIPSHRTLQVDVPTEVRPIGEPRHPRRVPSMRAEDPEARDVPRVVAEQPVTVVEIRDRPGVNVGRVESMGRGDRHLATRALRNPEQRPLLGVLHDPQRAGRPKSPVPDLLMNDNFSSAPHADIVPQSPSPNRGFRLEPTFLVVGRSMVKDAASRGYARGSETYRSARPSYHPTIIDDVVRRSASAPVVELGAGTGILTTELIARGLKVLGVEPVAAMREALIQAVGDANVRHGTAEHIPVASDAAGAVIAAQSFHWFDPHPALDEISRVLRPGGQLLTAWNVRDESVPWVAARSEIVDRHAGDAPRYRTMNWRRAIESCVEARRLVLRPALAMAARPSREPQPPMALVAPPRHRPRRHPA